MQHAIAICGKGNAASNALNLALVYLADAFEIHYFYLPHELEFASKLEAPCINTLRVAGVVSHAINSYDELEKALELLSPECIFLAQFSLIIKPALLNRFPYKIMNLHYGKLPFYRGVAPITHALLRHEKEFTTTIHYVDNGIDTGDIISEATFSIVNLINEEVYRLCEMHAAKQIESLFKILSESKMPVAYPQSEIGAQYFKRGSINYHQTEVDLAQSATDIIAYCRAFMFPSRNLYPTITYEGITRKIISVPKYCDNESFSKFKNNKRPDYVVMACGDAQLVFELSILDEVVE